MIVMNNLRFPRSYTHSNFLLSMIALSVSLSACSEGFEDVGWKTYNMPAASMTPVLIPGDHIIVNLRSYHDRDPQRGDIIVFQYPKDPTKDFVKRVIAIEGDVIQGELKAVYLNGEVLREKYINDSQTELEYPYKFGPLTIPEGKLFVMGDNRDHSYDSRHWGFVDVNAVRGKVFYVYWSKEFGRMFTRIE